MSKPWWLLGVTLNGLRCYAQHLKVGSWKWFSISNYCRENRVKNGICVANHTSPIDVFMLSCDNSYALVSLCSWLWPGHTIDCNAFVAGINHFENEFTEDFIFIIFLLCVCACMHVVCVCVCVCVGVYIYMCVCVCDCFTHEHVIMLCVCVCVCMCIYIHVCVCDCFTHEHVITLCVCMCMCVCVLVNVLHMSV